MGRKSSIDRLDPEIKAYIQAMLASGSMTLDELIADLQGRFPAAATAGDLPSRSAVGRYGQKLERRLSAIRASTEAAKLIQQHAGDDKDARSEALTAMVQTELFEAILMLHEADEQGENAPPKLHAGRVTYRPPHLRTANAQPLDCTKPPLDHGPRDALRRRPSARVVRVRGPAR